MDLMAKSFPKALGLAFLVAGTGCVVVDDGGHGKGSDEGPDTGQVEVSWNLGGRTCTEAGLATIQARLVDEGGTVFAESTAVCDDGRAVVGPVAPGTYRVVLQGASREGVVTHQGGFEAVEVEPAATASVPRLRLQARGATAHVEWFFANGRFCKHNAVDTVEVAVYDNLGREVHLMAYECTEGVITVESIPPGEVDFIGTALSATGAPLYRDHERVETTFGGQSTVELVLEDCELRTGGCL